MVKFDFQNLPSAVFSRLRNDYGLGRQAIELLSRLSVDIEPNETTEEVRMWGSTLAFQYAENTLTTIYTGNKPDTERATYQRLAELLELKREKREDAVADSRHLAHIKKGRILGYHDVIEQERARISILPIGRKIKIEHLVEKVADQNTMFEAVWRVAVKPLRAIS